MDAFIVAVSSVWTDSGFVNFNWGNAVMILVGLLLLYMAFAKEFEPLCSRQSHLVVYSPTFLAMVLKKGLWPLSAPGLLMKSSLHLSS